MSAALAATDMVLAREQGCTRSMVLPRRPRMNSARRCRRSSLVTKELEPSSAGQPISRTSALLHSQAQRCREILQKLTRTPDEQDPMHASVSASAKCSRRRRSRTARAASASIIGRRRRLQGRPRRDAAPSLSAQRRPGVIYGLGNLIENAIELCESREVDITARWNATARRRHRSPTTARGSRPK